MFFIQRIQQLFLGFQADPAGAAVSLLSTLLAVCIAFSFHEWAHAFVAYKLGDPTAKNMGRMSLNPLDHMDWIGLACFIFLGIGWAKPVVVNSRNLKHFRRDDVLISVSGPLMNLLLSFVFYGVIYLCFAVFGLSSTVLLQILFEIVIVNISLAIFNILPVPPLDGFHVVTSLFVRKGYRVVEFLQRYGYILLLILVFTGIISEIISPLANGLLRFYNLIFPVLG